MKQKVKITKTEILSDNWYVLKKVSFSYQKKNGDTEQLNREAYDRGNGATILLYNVLENKVILTRQFRLPTFINGNEEGMMIEACAGLLDKDNPEECIIREVEEETGYRIRDVKKIFEVYMSPGSVTEILYFFIGAYDKSQQISNGGGVEDEDIEVLEMDFDHAMDMIYNGGIKDAKTIMLLQYLKIHKILE